MSLLLGKATQVTDIHAVFSFNSHFFKIVAKILSLMFRQHSSFIRQNQILFTFTKFIPYNKYMVTVMIALNMNTIFIQIHVLARKPNFSEGACI